MEYLAKWKNNLTTTETQADDGEWILGIIPFYGRNMQVSELLEKTIHGW